MSCRDHDVVPGRKEGTERCRKCSWTFPCREDNCGHLQCIEFKGKLPQCYYCGERVQGSPAGMRMPDSTFLPLRQFGGEDASWTCWSVRGHARAVHYCCRDAKASSAELVGWYGQATPPVVCEHEFEQDTPEPAEVASVEVAG